jgi:hypothetical protein
VIEERALTVDGVALARAYAVTGQIVALDVVLATGADGDAVVDAVHDACADLPAASRPRRVKVVEELDLNQGKLVRTQR